MPKGYYKRTKPPWNKGKKLHYPVWNLGKTGYSLSMTPKRKAYIEKMVEISRKRIGPLSPNWKGGITPLRHKLRNSIEYKQWRARVFQRDNYTCVKCGQRGGELQADHIMPVFYYPEMATEMFNGRTLCVKCHKKTITYGLRGDALFKKLGLITR